MAVRERKKGSAEKVFFELTLKVWADRMRCTLNKGNCMGRDSEEQSLSKACLRAKYRIQRLIRTVKGDGSLVGAGGT